MNDNSTNQQSSDIKAKSVRELFGEKLENFKTRFADAAEDCNLTDELNELTVESISAKLLTFKMFWDLIENRDEGTLIELFELDTATIEDEAKVIKRKAALAFYTTMPDAERDWLWRYINFFLMCVKTI